MDGEQHPARVALRQAREDTIEQLSGGFARDELSLDEFERRVDQAYTATNAIELHELVADLSEVQRPMAVAQSANEAASIVKVPATQLTRGHAPWLAVAVFGNVEREVRSALQVRNRIMALFGNVELDLRSVVLPEGETELYVEAIFGNVEITVPPTLAVDCHGWSVFGSFQGINRLPMSGDGTALLRITGRSVFGNVEFHTRPRGYDHPHARLVGSHETSK